VLLIALAAVGCGGDDERATDTAPTVPDLTVPQTDETEPPETETETAPPPTTETTPPSDDGGTTAPPEETTPDNPENDTPPPADSPAERFEDFCNDNPGACG
jgi:hypothetical protein